MEKADRFITARRALRRAKLEFYSAEAIALGMEALGIYSFVEAARNYFDVRQMLTYGALGSVLFVAGYACHSYTSREISMAEQAHEHEMQMVHNPTSRAEISGMPEIKEKASKPTKRQIQAVLFNRLARKPSANPGTIPADN